MGTWINYYLIEDKDIKRAKQQNKDVLDLHYENRCNCTDKDCNCEWIIECFGTGVKSWEPTINLLKQLDNSTDQVVREVIDLTGHNWIDAPSLEISSMNVKRVKIALMQISDTDIDKAYSNNELIEKIKNMPGYRMSQIENRELVNLELEQLRKAFKQATLKEMGIAIKCE